MENCEDESVSKINNPLQELFGKYDLEETKNMVEDEINKVFSELS